jgi:general secretion pathway protein G
MDRRWNRKTARRRTRGMTLVEIMVVVAIIGMIMGSVAVGALGAFEKAKVKNTKVIIHTVQEALVHYATDNTDGCPKSLDELVTQKYLTHKVVDDWGQPLIFQCPGQHNTDSADIVSKGKDKTEGTADDIKSWEL